MNTSRSPPELKDHSQDSFVEPKGKNPRIDQVPPVKRPHNIITGMIFLDKKIFC
jgi:hypothetical protein